MQRFRNEHTIATSCEIHGRGYWTGQEVCVTIHPASMGTGVLLVRTDLEGMPECLATVHHREDASLRTNLVGDSAGSQPAAKFQMVEHLMAALAALEIDNCVVEIDGEEFPAFDGSSLEFAEVLSRAGLIIQAATRQTVVVDRRYRVGNADGWVEVTPAKHGEAYYEYQLSFDDDTPIAPQTYGIELTPDKFLREVASARTFITSEQADQIRSTGKASHVTNQDLVVIGPEGPLENEFRFDNECARHKTLDLIGDLMLAGVELVGRFTSFRGGHNLNGQMASLLADLAEHQKLHGQKFQRIRSSDFLSHPFKVHRDERAA